MDSGKKLMDVSSFLLFEAFGDSEQLDSDPDMDVSEHGIDVDKDDAESCSCEVSQDIIRIDDDELDQCCDDYYYYGDFDEETKEDGDGNDQVWTSKPMGLQRPAFGSAPADRKSSVCADSSSKGEMNEMEKSRLFWEACLAS